jgi:hypothetical protein
MNTPADVIPDVLVLAVMERAERHRARGHSDIPIWTILEHLDNGQSSNTWTFRDARQWPVVCALRSAL